MPGSFDAESSSAGRASALQAEAVGTSHSPPFILTYCRPSSIGRATDL
ncbi:hypothetical protein ACVNP0_10300 [Staphylococcus aureus]